MSHQAPIPPSRDAPRSAIAALVLGLLTFVAGILTGIPAILCGRRALSVISASGNRKEGKGFAYAGIVLGYLSIAAFLVYVLVFLASLLFPDVAAATGMGKKKAAREAIQDLKRANLAHFTEYESFPVEGTEEQIFDSDERVMNDLTGQNLRGIMFLVEREARLGRGGRYRRGVATDEEGDVRLWDPWGNFYRLRFDFDGDGAVRSPDGSRSISQNILIWSRGRDGLDGTRDDIRSW